VAKLTIQLGATIGKLKRGLASARSELKNWSKRVAKLGKVAIGVGVGAFAAGLAGLTKRAVTLAAQFQQTQVAFNAMLGDSQKAAALIEALTEFSTKTPFSPEKVQQAAKTLLSFGFTADEVKKSLKPLGDVAAGTGKDFQELAVIFGQIKSAGRLMGQDLLQLINAGFNPLQVMSEKTGKSVAQLKDEMSKGLITFEQVEQAFIDATSAGGLFNDMMAKQSETLIGKVSTLKGNFDEFLKGIARGTTGPLTDMLDRLNDIVKKMVEVANAGEKAAQVGAKIEAPLGLASAAADGLAIAYGIGKLKIESQAATAEELAEALKKVREAQVGSLDELIEGARIFNVEGKDVTSEVEDLWKALDGLGDSVGDAMTDMEAEDNKMLMGLGGPPDPRRKQRAALREGIAVSKERAAELEKSIGAAFRPQGEIASNLSRIGGERGIAVSRNIPEKQLQELVAIRDGIKVLENQLGKLDGPPRFL
jgi:tape measure domain-containing protein